MDTIELKENRDRRAGAVALCTYLQSSSWRETVLAPLVGLSAPAMEALTRGNSFISALKPQVLPGLIAGFIAGVATFELTLVQTDSATCVYNAGRKVK